MYVCVLIASSPRVSRTRRGSKSHFRPPTVFRPLSSKTGITLSVWADDMGDDRKWDFGRVEIPVSLSLSFRRSRE